MPISLTLFKNVFDNKTHQRLDFRDFDSFESVLYKLSEKSSSQISTGAWPTQRANTDSKQAATITQQCCLPMLAIAAELGSVYIQLKPNRNC